MLVMIPPPRWVTNRRLSPESDPTPERIEWVEWVDAGQGWVGLGTPTVTGRVRAVFRRAAYVDVDGELLAVCDESVPPGPLHLRVARLPPLAAGDTFSIEGLDRVPRWQPAAIDPDGLERHRADAVALLNPDSRRNRGRSPTLIASSSEDLVGVARLIGGRGPGLTPAGDDVLAGILVVSAVRARPVDPEVRAAAAVARPTTEIARAFLRWAASGLSIAPVHDLLAAVSRGDPAPVRAAHDRLLGIGATSGADLAYGLGLALSAQPSTRTTSTSGPSARVPLT
jgi:hypothetical protein